MAAQHALLNGVSEKTYSGSYCMGCTIASVVFGRIVATLLHHTRDRKVERKFLNVSGVPSLKWKTGEWNSGSIICRPPLLKLDTCVCLWYTQHTCPSGLLDEEVHAS